MGWAQSRRAWLLAVMLAGTACSSAVPTAGEQAFEQNCATCHAGNSLPQSAVSGLSDPNKRAALDRFLSKHHATDPQVRAEIIRYLAEDK